MKKIGTKNRDTGGVVKASTEYFVATFTNVSFAPDTGSGLMHSGIKTDVSDQLFRLFESFNVHYFGDEADGGDWTNTWNCLKEFLLRFSECFKLFFQFFDFLA